MDPSEGVRSGQAPTLIQNLQRRVDLRVKRRQRSAPSRKGRGREGEEEKGRGKEKEEERRGERREKDAGSQNQYHPHHPQNLPPAHTALQPPAPAWITSVFPKVGDATSNPQQDSRSSSSLGSNCWEHFLFT